MCASTVSAHSGMGKGIEWLSNIDMVPSIALLGFFLIFGSTFFGPQALVLGTFDHNDGRPSTSRSLAAPYSLLPSPATDPPLSRRMTNLTITLTGEVRESNFEEWKDGLVERIRAVDVELSADDDFASANDSIRQFRAAEQTLKSAKQAALEQAADINRLFDAVDAATEEARQARLALERRIRVRRQELRQRTLQTHSDNNAATLDALPAVQQALFQDRASLLALPFDELESTIAHRIGVWQATLADPAARLATDASGDPDESDASDGADARRFAGGPTGERVVDAEHAPDVRTPSGDDAIGSAADDAPRAWRVTIDLSAPRAKADQLFARVRDRWRTDRAVTGVELVATDRDDRSGE